MSENLSDLMAQTFSENEELKVKLDSMTRQRDRLLTALASEADAASLPNHWAIIASNSRQEVVGLSKELAVTHNALNRMRFACGKMVSVLESDLTGEALYTGVRSAILEAKEALKKTSDEFPLFATAPQKPEGFPVSYVP